MKRLGFDFNWNSCIGANNWFLTPFKEELLEEKPDGSKIIRDSQGLITLVKPGVVSIPAEIGTTLTDRSVWEELYLPKFQWDDSRVNKELFKTLASVENREIPLGLHCGSLYGNIRNMLGVQELSYLYVDDEDLYVEIIDAVANLAYKCVEEILKTGAIFDYAHFWADNCF